MRPMHDVSEKIDYLGRDHNPNLEVEKFMKRNKCGKQKELFEEPNEVVVCIEKPSAAGLFFVSF